MELERRATAYPTAFIINTSMQTLKEADELNEDYMATAYRCTEIELAVADKEGGVPRTIASTMVNAGPDDIT